MSDLPKEVLESILGHMVIRQRFSCAQVSQKWKAAATAATRTIVLHKKHGEIRLQRWLEMHGSQLQALQLQASATYYLPEALPCPQLEDLHLHAETCYSWHSVDDRVWDDISAATKLKSVSLDNLKAARGSEEIMALLAALPNLHHLAWRSMDCCGERYLPGVPSLQRLTKLTGLELKDVTAGALEQLSAFTKLRHLSVDGVPPMWGFKDFPALQQLTFLTRLHLGDAIYADVIPLVVNRLTAVQHLGLHNTSYERIQQLHALSGLTSLSAKDVGYMYSPPSPLQLPALQRLELGTGGLLSLDSSVHDLPMSYVADCRRLQVLSLSRLVLRDPGCVLGLTSLKHASYCLLNVADVERLVTCCSGIRTSALAVRDKVTLSALAQLPYLTSLSVAGVDEQQCSSVAQLTGLRQLCLGRSVTRGCKLTTNDLLELMALRQLTSLGLTHGSLQVPAGLLDRMPDRLPGCSYAIVSKVRGASLSRMCCRRHAG